MVDLEKMNGDYHHTSPVGKLTSSAGRFGADILELVELQGKLLKADAKRTMEKSMGAAISALIGLFCLMGCLPILSFGLASAVSHYFKVESWISQLAIGGGLSFVSMIIVISSLRTLATNGMQFKRSAEEFSKNLEWAKDVFSGAGSKK